MRKSLPGVLIGPDGDGPDKLAQALALVQKACAVDEMPKKKQKMAKK